MKTVNPTFEVLTPIDGDEMLKHIERCGRECYQSQHKVTTYSHRDFVRMILSNHHESVLEHVSLTIRFTVDRGVSHELVRHRHTSPSQESTRYCNYSNDKFENEVTFVDIARAIELDTKMNKLNPFTITSILQEWYSAMENAEDSYIKLIKLGATPQIARGVLPNSLKTSITVTANLREWRLILKQRTPIAAHPQMREVMIPLATYLNAKIPVIFEDIVKELY